jgi:hypothetical protein
MCGKTTGDPDRYQCSCGGVYDHDYWDAVDAAAERAKDVQRERLNEMGDEYLDTPYDITPPGDVPAETETAGCPHRKG